MTVDDIFFIKGRGLVATGRVEAGVLHVGDELEVNGAKTVAVAGIEAFRKILDAAKEGDDIGVLFKDLERGDVNAGDVLSSGDAAAPTTTDAALGSTAESMGLEG